MRYISTRGTAPELGFSEVLLAGLATDGGLYVPKEFPQLSADKLTQYAHMSYVDIAVDVMAPFVDIPRDDFAKLVADAYGTFTHPDTVPLIKLSDGTYVLELFHGPTLAFKDVALQLLGRLFDYVLTKQGKRVTIVGATSGDTGSAAIEACKNRDAIDIFILHPQGRTSDVQRKQMTTVTADNVHNIALKGTFDDCQDAVKAMFNDNDFRTSVNLSAVNSINWARIMAQVVYYVYAVAKTGSKDTTVSVPTGNFGNIYAAYVASRMGVPIKQFMVASNANDILTRFFANNDMSINGVNPTLSPSMDIQISSNFERLLFEMYDRDGTQVAKIMDDFRETGKLPVETAKWQKVSETFKGYSLDDKGTSKAIADYQKSENQIFDPHSVIGVKAVHDGEKPTTPTTITAATAHPAKFPDAVKTATGIHPDLPEHLADLFERDEKFEVLENDVDGLMAFVRGRI